MTMRSYTRWCSSERTPLEIATSNVLSEGYPSTNDNPAVVRKVIEANSIVKAAVQDFFKRKLNKIAME
ncbi:hypothetical protein N7527_003984 [Penicillium freii]|nr:hypothetical protein N7527_003984 [Penicillium freii]